MERGSEIIVDNCQVNLYGGFAPASQTAVELSKSLGSRTVMSGSISRGKNDPSQSLQMMERPLMTPDELKSMPKGSFIVAKTGVHPMKVKLRLFLDWGIRFGMPYEVPEKAQRFVAYADKQELEESIIRRHYGTIVMDSEQPQGGGTSAGGMAQGNSGRTGFPQNGISALTEGNRMNSFRNIYNSNLSHRAKSVYMYLKDRADSEGRCWPAIRTIALELGLSRSTVKRALDDLCKTGLLQKYPRWRENGSLTSNLYHVV